MPSAPVGASSLENRPGALATELSGLWVDSFEHPTSQSSAILAPPGFETE